MKGKQGLSAVVTTLIIILLVLVAVGIIWMVVGGMVEEGAQQVDIQSKCLTADVRATAASCAENPVGPGTWECDVTLERKAGTGSDDIAGVMLVFSNTAGSGSAVDAAGNIEVLGTKSLTNQLAGTTGTPDKVEVSVYFKDSAGETQICGQARPYTIA